MAKKLFFLILFGIAFGFVEAAVVFYLRLLLHYNSGYLQDGYKVLLNIGFIAFVYPSKPILQTAQVTLAETVREFATIIMLISVSYLSAKYLLQRVGAFLISFALWDIFYYVFLRLLTGWPKSLFDTDIYFLIPVAWIGPIITPLIISSLLFILGTALYVLPGTIITKQFISK